MARMSNSRVVRVVLIVSMTIACSLVGARPSHAADEKSPTGPKNEKPNEKQKEKQDQEAGKTATHSPKTPARSDKAAAAEVTLKGDLTCARCGLHEGTVCQNVLRVKEAAGAEAKYYLTKNAVAEENHGKVCGGSAPATVTGKLSSEGGKKIITPSSVTFD
jgi:hypothetical protein